MYISTCNWNYTPQCGLLQPWIARTSSWWKKIIPLPLQGNVQQQYIHEQHLQHRQRSGAKLWLCGHPRRVQVQLPIPDFESPKQSFLSLRPRINGIPQKGPQAFPNMVYNWEIRANQHPKSEKRMVSKFSANSEHQIIPSGNLPIWKCWIFP